MKTLTKNQWIGVIVALAVVGFMFYGMNYLYSKIISDNQSASAVETMSDNKSGLQSEVLATGVEGDEAQAGDRVYVDYVGELEDGTEFDNSFKRGQPIDFVLGSGQVIKGWEQGILGMKVGEKRKLTIPYELAYGENGYGPIPPKATLIFEVTLVKVEKKQ